jgi:hypothetical protein
MHNLIVPQNNPVRKVSATNTREMMTSPNNSPSRFAIANNYMHGRQPIIKLRIKDHHESALSDGGNGGT